jgi:GxxExxY protein
MLADAAFNGITHEIISAGIDVHRALGPGLLESAYIPCLHQELATRKLRFVTERCVPIVYKGTTLDTRYRIDLIVEDIVVVEVKSVEQLLSVHQAQVVLI